MNQTIAQIIQDFSLDIYEPIFPRTLDLGEPLAPRAGNLATVITGMRRSGKTYRMFQEMGRLVSSGVDSGRLLYFSFEDSRLGCVTPQTGDEVIEAFREMRPGAFEQGVYLFFDEIQEMADWDLWLRRVIDTVKATIYVTGSSSKLLVEDVASAFRGRSVAYELLPLGFEEYARFHNLKTIAAKKAVPPTSTQAARLRTAFAEYLRRGGFPAVQDQLLPRAILTLQSYAQRVVAKDVLERHNLSNPQAVAYFARRVLASTGREISLRKIENDARSQGMPVGRALLSQCLDYFQDAYLVGTVKERSHALSGDSNVRSKVYAIDPGLALANAPASSQDDGQRLETAVYLELRRRRIATRRGDISSLKTRGHGYEVDFLAGDALDYEGQGLYQVCLNLFDEHTRMRELRALNEAMGELSLHESYLIVGEGNKEDIKVDTGVVHQVPAWRWCLGV